MRVFVVPDTKTNLSAMTVMAIACCGQWDRIVRRPDHLENVSRSLFDQNLTFLLLWLLKLWRK